ncbi:hypothetical protein DFH09DRAFT_1348948 [Mycena vulgaris]|nr:hypothetical protein DFH09DRAFT_1348948 [Mycena vulgaris]
MGTNGNIAELVQLIFEAETGHSVDEIGLKPRPSSITTHCWRRGVLKRADAPEPSLAVLARMCKAFHEPSLALLWRYLKSLVPLFSCMPPDPKLTPIDLRLQGPLEWVADLPLLAPHLPPGLTLEIDRVPGTTADNLLRQASISSVGLNMTALDVDEP